MHLFKSSTPKGQTDKELKSEVVEIQLTDVSHLAAAATIPAFCV